MWKRNISQLPPIHAPTRDQPHNPDMCPDQELNLLQPVGPPGQDSLWLLIDGFDEVCNFKVVIICCQNFEASAF